MTETKFSNTILVVIFVTCTLIAIGLFTEVNTRPVDVKHTVDMRTAALESELIELKLDIEKIASLITEINERVIIRNDLLTQIIDELPSKTRDRIYRQEVELWAEQVQRDNPGIKIPPIPQLVEAIADPPEIKIER